MTGLRCRDFNWHDFFDMLDEVEIQDDLTNG
jgi:hypothetical protein